MHNRIELLSGAALVALASGSAFAADLPRRTEPAPVAPIYAPPIFTWTGAYVGLNAGATINDSRYSFAPFFNSYAQSGVGFTGGGQIGYNWQTGPLVIGAETDINFRSGTSGSGNGWASSNNSSGYFGTLRGRIGYAWDRVLIYGAGGLAYGNANFPTTVVGIDAFGVPRAFYGSNNAGTRLGWTAGAGVEWAFAPNWSVKAEYLYVDLGRSNVSYTGALLVPVVASAQNRDHVVRMGVNYHF
jgi:outer membrane immunogenic protein